MKQNIWPLSLKNLPSIRELSDTIYFIQITKMINHLFYLHILVSWFWRMNHLFKIQLCILLFHPQIHMWTHPFPLPQTTPQHHWTHKESFAREVGFEARGGAGLKASALFWVSEPVRRSIKSGVGKSNTEKFSLGGNRGSPSVRIFRRCGAQRVEWRHFSKQDEMAAAKEERQRPESILKKRANWDTT